MSGFRETFTKAEKENVLGYDDSASLHFGGCVLFCIVAPWTYYFLFRNLFYNKTLKSKKNAAKISKDCLCQACVKLEEADASPTTSIKMQRFCSCSFITQLIFILVLWVIFGQVIRAISYSSTQIQVFDPFDILELDMSASFKDIRKAYRTLSLRFHPDKNPNDPSAAAKFIMISKAYQALTDEVAKENFKKYGNPDGPTAMKIGIGLPHFLVEEKYQLAILLVIFSVLLIIVPTIFIVYYQKQKRYASNGMLLETAYLCGLTIKESTRIKNMPEILAASGESRESTKLRPADNVDMKPVMQHIEEYGKRILPNATPIVLKNYYLILAHMQKLHNVLSPTLRSDLESILKSCILITQSIAEYSIYNGWILTAQSAIEFRRCLLQGLGPSDNSLLQIPHFTGDCLKHCLRGKNIAKDLKSFINQPRKDRKGLSDMSAEQLADIDAFLAHVPLITLELNAYVNDENEIAVGDVVTVSSKITRTNLQDNELAGHIHAPLFPVPKYEEWWIFLQEKTTGKLVGFTRSKGREKVTVESVQFIAAKKGRWSYTVLAMCDSYAGLDVVEEITVQILDTSEIRRRVYVHPDDEALDNDPSLLEQVLGIQRTQSNFSEDDEEGIKTNNYAEDSEN